MKNIVNHFKNKNILVTGGAGSIGIELVKKLIDFDVNLIRIFDNSEYRLFFLERSFDDTSKLRFTLGDISDYNEIDMATKDIDIVFHCAAVKNIAVSENNPLETVKVNITGTQNVLVSAIKNDVKQLVFLSSDKVVDPTSIQGASKLVGEKMVLEANNYKAKRDIRCSCIRFGNVLGTSASIIHSIGKQLQNNQEPHITDRRMTRFIIMMEQLVDTILEATTMNLDGKIVIPKMKAVLVENIIKATIDIFTESDFKRELKETGIRKGEKLYEVLMTETELLLCDEFDNMIITPREENEVNNFKLGYDINSDNAKKISYEEIKDMISRTIKNDVELQQFIMKIQMNSKFSLLNNMPTISQLT